MTSSLKFEITVYFFWLSLQVHSGSLKRIDYPKQLSGPPSFLINSTALKGTLNYILFVVTAAGVVPCGIPKKIPRP